MVEHDRTHAYAEIAYRRYLTRIKEKLSLDVRRRVKNINNTFVEQGATF